MKITRRYGGVVHLLSCLAPGMAAKTKCGVVFAQWRGADRTGRKCKRCKP